MFWFLWPVWNVRQSSVLSLPVDSVVVSVAGMERTSVISVEVDSVLFWLWPVWNVVHQCRISGRQCSVFCDRCGTSVICVEFPVDRVVFSVAGVERQSSVSSFPVDRVVFSVAGVCKGSGEILIP